ncbi:glycosyltransferase family 2 protein [Nocardioides sp.]|uniref:glycosyltransferase family 2 protein n=1 Tax=Nocardioides sp. TaxID=35761 RepID=UPI00261D446D|nr:glycosyltransferase family 2 protein [Nocardioides sp.]
MTASLTVIIPSVGRPELSRAISSVRDQTVRVEVIVVLDDPSAQNAVRSMLREDERLVITPGRRGGGFARAAGTELVETIYVAYLDDDDWWEPDKAAEMVQAMEDAHAEIGWSSVRFRANGKADRILPEQPFEPGQRMLDYLVLRPGLRHGYGYVQSSALVCRTDLAASVGWDPGLRKHQDWDFVSRVFDEAHGHVFVDRPLVNVAQDSAGSISRRRDWRDSLPFYKRHAAGMGRRARGDFVMVHLARSAFASGEFARGVSFALRGVGSVPHVAAVISAMFGVVEWSRRRRIGR